MIKASKKVSRDYEIRLVSKLMAKKHAMLWIVITSQVFMILSLVILLSAVRIKERIPVLGKVQVSESRVITQIQVQVKSEQSKYLYPGQMITIHATPLESDEKLKIQAQILTKDKLIPKQVKNDDKSLLSLSNVSIVLSEPKNDKERASLERFQDLLKNDQPVKLVLIARARRAISILFEKNIEGGLGPVF